MATAQVQFGLRQDMRLVVFFNSISSAGAMRYIRWAGGLDPGMMSMRWSVVRYGGNPKGRDTGKTSENCSKITEISFGIDSAG